METVSAEFLKSIGGRTMYTGMSKALYFGYRPPGDRSLAEDEAAERLKASGVIREFNPAEDIPEITGDEVKLWRYERVANGNILLPRNWQVTGSCVNGGGQNAVSSLVSIEKLMLTAPESIFLPFTLLAYGAARGALGDRGEGEGASASQFAQELYNIGVGDTELDLYPKPQILDIDGSVYKDRCLVYPEGTELKYSSARNATPAQLADAAKSKIKQIRIRSAQEAIKELRRGRPLTWAGDWGGKMTMSYAGEPRVLYCERRYDTWYHQESCTGWWNHPTLGSIFNILNQWFMKKSNGLAASVHGPVSDDSPSGSYWIPEKEFEYQCRSGEVCSIYNAQGRIKNLDWYVAA